MGSYIMDIFLALLVNVEANCIRIYYNENTDVIHNSS
jgi:hypothetical protein